MGCQAALAPREYENLVQPSPKLGGIAPQVFWWTAFADLVFVCSNRINRHTTRKLDFRLSDTMSILVNKDTRHPGVGRGPVAVVVFSLDADLRRHDG